MLGKGTTGGGTIVLELPSGAELPLMLETVRDNAGDEMPDHLDEVLSAAAADEPLADWLEPETQRTWYGGCGAPRSGYWQAPGCDTRFGDSDQGYVFPGPSATAVVLPGLHNSVTPIWAIRSWGGYVYVLQQGTGSNANTARVMRGLGATGALAEVLNLGAADTLNDLLVFDNGSGVKQLWAAGNDGAGGRLHYSATGALASWTSTASALFGTHRRDYLAKVWWRTANGDQGARMATRSANAEISYTKPNTDPALAASWVEGVKIETSGALAHPVGGRRHLFFPATDNLYDLDEQGNSPGLTSWMDKAQHPYNGLASLYLGNWVYMTVGQDLCRIWVGDGAVIQEESGVCTPGAYTGAQHEYGGFPTALTVQGDWVVCSTFSPNTLRSAIWWGRDRKFYPNVETQNPMVWHGPLITSVGNQIVTAMEMVPDVINNIQVLYVASIPYDATTFYGGSVAQLAYFTIPVVGHPLNDLLTSGKYKFATGSALGNWQPYARVYSMPLAGPDKASTKIEYHETYGTQGLDVPSGTKLTTYVRADPVPGSAAWGTSADVTASPTGTVERATEVTGRQLQYRVDLFAPNGGASTPQVGLLDAVRIEWWRVVTSFRVLNLDVAYGDAVPGLSGTQDDTRDPEDIRVDLEALTGIGRFVLRTSTNKRYTVKARQVLNTRWTKTEGTYGQRATSTLQIAILGALS